MKNSLEEKKTCQIVDFAVRVIQVKVKENEKKDKYLDLARELKKKTMEHESDGDTNCIWGMVQLPKEW